MIADYRSKVFKGVMGDHAGVNSYGSISTESLSKWVAILNNGVRRRYARRLLRSYDQETLAAFRLSPDDLMAVLERAPGSPRYLMKDIFWLLLSWLGRRFALNAILGQAARQRPYKVD